MTEQWLALSVNVYVCLISTLKAHWRHIDMSKIRLHSHCKSSKYVTFRTVVGPGNRRTAPSSLRRILDNLLALCRLGLSWPLALLHGKQEP